jgi:ABC-2 type transport system ATP-binding protein
VVSEKSPNKYFNEILEAMNVVETHGLTMSYGPVDVLRGVDIQVAKGEVLALLGPNGAGKTTTIEILEGFRERTGGEVRVLGADPGTGNEAWRARLGIVLQSWRDHGKWRVRELLGHVARYYTPYGTPYTADELIDLIGLTAQAKTTVALLSGGQRRRLDVAIGLVGRPELLFLDEPTVGFDPEARQDFHELVRRLDTTILLTTHDLAEAEKLADRIMILAGGEIVASGTAAELAARISGRSEVRYRRGGQSYLDLVGDATEHVRDLFSHYGWEIQDLEVRRTSLEDVYLSMVRKFESEVSA